VVLVTQSGKQALLELDRETLAIDPADYDQVYFERQAVGSRPQTDDSSQWATWTEPDGTVVIVEALHVEAHRLGRWGPKPRRVIKGDDGELITVGKSFDEWWEVGSDEKFLDEALENIQNATTRGRVSV
jgi:hypothetical protein